jgi:hypothetical protein
MWRWLAVGATALIVLVLPAAASGKDVAKILVVGANGRSVNLGSGWALYSQLRPDSTAEAAAPSGSYLLLYPVMETALPMEPGRYFPAAQVACWSWTLSLEGCVTVGRLPATWDRTRGLAPFALDPTTLRTLSHNGQPYTVPSNGTVAIELALSRTRLARAAPRAPCGWELQATWQGPDASVRPTTLCVRKRGISTDRRLYPLTPLVARWLRVVS